MQINKLLTEKKEIENFLQSKLKSDQIAVDIEFMRRNTFFPEPCVIQISDGKNHACIDLTLDLNYKKIFQEIFSENKIIIMHSCRQDLEILNLIEKRKKLVDRVVKLKTKDEIVDQKRIDSILRKLDEEAKKKMLPSKMIKGIWEKMINGFIEYEKRYFEK